MPAFPLPLLVRLTPAEADPVEMWWNALSDTDRAELLILWSRRGNDCRFSRAADGDEPPEWRRLPIVGGEFTDNEQPGDDWVPGAARDRQGWSAREPTTNNPATIGCQTGPITC